MAIITLTTDFGIQDEYVGVMKGVILSIDPSAVIVDITHQIDPQDLIQAAYTIESSYRFFPEGTVHVVVVDPGVGSQRAIIALKTAGHIFLAPDNGVLSVLIDKAEVEAVMRVENSDCFLAPVSRTFHGRDIFAPVAAHISKGFILKRLGAVLEPQNLLRLPIEKPCLTGKRELKARIVSIDRFGNLITNVDSESLHRICAPGSEKGLEIRVGDQRICGLSASYQSVNPQTPLAIVGSRGYLEVAVSCGNARRYFEARKGDAIRVSFP